MRTANAGRIPASTVDRRTGVLPRLAANRSCQKATHMLSASLHPALPVLPIAPATVPASIDWRDVPVFIVNRNRLGALRQLVDWLCAAGTRRVVILDNASDYTPLLAYYAELPPAARVMLLPENHGPYVLWKQGVHKVLDTPYVVTDSDVVPAGFCPHDLIDALLAQLQRHPDARKVGAALRIDNLPDSYGEADTVRKWESQFWEHPVAPGVFAAPVDTTFAIYPAFGEFSNDAGNLRLGHPYIAEHTPWYVDEAALSAEERYYRDHTSATFSNWSVAKKDSWVRKSERVAGFEQRARVLHIDGGREYIPGWINAGVGVGPGGVAGVIDEGAAAGHFDIAFDATRAREQRLPLTDDSLDGLHLSHVLEGVRDAQALFEELYRVAKPNAKLFIRVAYGARGNAWQDPAQQRAWTEGSFAHFGQPGQPAHTSYRGDWQLDSVSLVASPGEAGAHPEPLGDSRQVSELIVVLHAVKPARTRLGLHPVPQITPTLIGDERVDPAFPALPPPTPITAPLGNVVTSEPAAAAAPPPRTLFLLHEQRYLYFLEPSYLELYLPMLESGLLGETMVYAYQRDIRFVRRPTASDPHAEPASDDVAADRFRILLEQKIKEFKPDLLVYALTWPQEAIAPLTLASLKREHGFRLASVIWDHDETNPLLQRYDRDIIGVSDCTIVADSATRANAIRGRCGPYAAFENVESVVFMPMVPPASVFFPVGTRQHDVTISGSGEGQRVAVFDRLVAEGFDVHRSGGMMPGDTLLPVADYAHDLAASRIVVNTQTMDSRVQIKGRVAQCLASGTLLLEQDNVESRAYLSGIDVPLWRDVDELMAMLRHHLANPDEREALALRTHRQWTAKYNADRFVKTLLDGVSAGRPAAPEAERFCIATDAG